MTQQLSHLEAFLKSQEPFASRFLKIEQIDQRAVISIQSDGLSLAQKIELEKKLTEQFPEIKIRLRYEAFQKPHPHKKENTQPHSPQSIPHVKHIVAITSAKGGVGKSTITAHLALSASRLGYRVGLLDADVYGPSIPTLFQLEQEPGLNAEQKIVPLSSHGLKLMSFGFFVPSDAAVMWRGPLVHKALLQLFFSVDWGELDILLIDMPPGTGDAHLNLLQNLKLSGSILISTPHDLALADVKRGYSMYQKLKIPVLGIVENMSYYISPKTHEKSYPFQGTGLKEFLLQHPIPHIQVPLHPDLTLSGSDLNHTSPEIQGIFKSMSQWIQNLSDRSYYNHHTSPQESISASK